MNQFRKGLKDGIPIGLGYLSVSFTFGIMAVDRGMTFWQAMLISMTNLTSAGQFAGLNVMLAAGTYLEMFLAELVINLRYSLMSISLSQKVDDGVTRIYRWLIGFAITDEIFAVDMSQKGKISKQYMFGIMIIPYLGWQFGTLFGAVFGSILPAAVVSALSAAIYGMYLAIVVPVAKKDNKVLKVVLMAVWLACCFQWIPLLNKISVGFAITICAVVASAIGAILWPVEDEEEVAN